MGIRIGLVGDTMLGRGVAQRLAADGPERLFSPDLVDVAHEADLLVLNLECCVSVRGTRWPARGKPFFFRAPPAAVDALARLGVDCVTLANNHALDYGHVALLDTLAHLDAGGIGCAGAGPDLYHARRPVELEAAGVRVGVIGLSDHPRDYAAGPDRPGIAYAELRSCTTPRMPPWVTEQIERAHATCDLVLVTPHWGPNMTAAPVRHVRAAAAELVASGAGVVAGHSAHVFHGVQGPVLFDLGDFLDDYATDPVHRNDLGLFWLVTVDDAGMPTQVEAVPLHLDFAHTRLATAAEAAEIEARFRSACAALGTVALRRVNRFVVRLR